MILGICGKSGSGKTTLSKKIIELSDKQVVHLDIDKIGHFVLTKEEVKEELVRQFGEKILNNDSIDRKKLGEIVFNSRKEMKKLEEITWKNMQIEIDRFLEENKDNVIILDWLLLYKTKYFNLCDIKVLLDVPYEERKKRAMKRDSITEEAFDLREKSSIDFNKDDFDYVIKENDEGKVKKMVNSL